MPQQHPAVTKPINFRKEGGGKRAGSLTAFMLITALPLKAVCLSLNDASVRSQRASKEQFRVIACTFSVQCTPTEGMITRRILRNHMIQSEMCVCVCNSINVHTQVGKSRFQFNFLRRQWGYPKQVAEIQVCLLVFEDYKNV